MSNSEYNINGGTNQSYNPRPASNSEYNINGTGSGSPANNSTDSMYQLAAKLFIHEKKKAWEVKDALVQVGLSEPEAEKITNEVDEQINGARKAQAQKDILYGALWCVGGIVFTVADIGYIFWGAIVFGAIQLIKGLANA